MEIEPKCQKFYSGIRLYFETNYLWYTKAITKFHLTLVIFEIPHTLAKIKILKIEGLYFGQHPVVEMSPPATDEYIVTLYSYIV